MATRNRIASAVLELILYLSVTPTKISVPLSCFRTIDRSRRRLRAPARRTSFCYDDVSRCRPAATATAAEAGRPGSIGAGPCRALVGPCHTSRAVAASGLRRWLNSDGHLGRAAGSARVICSQDMDDGSRLRLVNELARLGSARLVLAARYSNKLESQLGSARYELELAR
jgi:hypothetical protein